MEENSRQSGILIAIAGLGLVLGVIALVVALSAKSTSDDAATQTEVTQVSSELSNLVDRLGIAEASLKGQQNLNGEAKNAIRESHNATVNLSNRLDKLEKRTAALTSSSKQSASQAKQIDNLTRQVGSLENQVEAVNARVTKLTKRINSVSASASNSGGKSAP